MPRRTILALIFSVAVAAMIAVVANYSPLRAWKASIYVGLLVTAVATGYVVASRRPR
jgi:hypothetical protein